MRGVISAKSHSRPEIFPEDLKLNDEITIRRENMEVTNKGDVKDVGNLRRKDFMDSLKENQTKGCN